MSNPYEVHESDDLQNDSEPKRKDTLESPVDRDVTHLLSEDHRAVESVIPMHEVPEEQRAGETGQRVAPSHALRQSETLEGTNANSREALLEAIQEPLQGTNRVARLYEKGLHTEARNEAETIVEDIRKAAEKIPGQPHDASFQNYDAVQNEAGKEKNPNEQNRLYSLAMAAVDFIPVIGSGKMLAEGAAGRTLGGEKLRGGWRLLHTLEGGIFLALDLTGIGALGSEAIKGSKILTRSAALMRVAGVSARVYKPVFRTGRFVARHPSMAKLADKGVRAISKRRTTRKIRVIGEVESELDRRLHGAEKKAA